MIHRLRFVTGLVLFAYVVVHLLDLSLVIVSVGTADAMLVAIYPIVTSAPVTALLLDAAAIHLALALWALWRRRTLRVAPYEAAQYLLGFSVPLLLAPHVFGTRVADALYGADFGYYRNVLLQFWYFEPWRSAAQIALLLAAWIHACIGLRSWLRLRSWFSSARPSLTAAALLIPALALAGFVAGGNEITFRLAADPTTADRALAVRPLPWDQQLLADQAAEARAAVLAALAAVLLARLVRHLVRRRRGLVRIAYPDGRSVAVPPGISVLEASRLLGVPHASICGGRGRCTTCRVRVSAPADSLPTPGVEEQRALRRVGAGPGVRLACQLRPLGAIAVVPLFDAGLPARELLRFRSPQTLGTERGVAVLFADLRDFTRLTENRLPFDVVYLLNRYFRAMGESVEAAGGRVDKFVGDGVMALFGAEYAWSGANGPAEDLRNACRRGLDAARRMSLALEALNRGGVAAELGEPLRIGIGLHAGLAILGDMGHGRALGATAIGDTVNTASRLEAACKELGCELVVSAEVLAAAGAGEPGEAHKLAVRGRSVALQIRAVARAADLPANLDFSNASKSGRRYRLSSGHFDGAIDPVCRLTNAIRG
jgi:adenylate cyclase